MEQNREQIETTTSSNVIHIKKKRFIWIVVVLTIIILLGLGALRIFQNSMSIGVGGDSYGVALPSSGGGGMSADSIIPRTPNRNSQSDYRDNREFLKVNYGASFKTRRVERVMDKAEDAVRDANGRVDNLSVNKKHGSMSFVVPKVNFGDFKDDMEKISHRKLYTESTSSQNLLNQKQNIEERGEQANESLDDLLTNKANVSATHDSKIASLNVQLSSAQNQLNTLRVSMSTTEDADILESLQKQEVALVQQITSLNKQISTENSSYNSQIRSIDNRIAQAEGVIKQVEEDDVDFTANIETVSGSVQARWITNWEMARIFLPIRPGWVIVILVLIGFLYLRKTGKLPAVKFV